MLRTSKKYLLEVCIFMLMYLLGRTKSTPIKDSTPDPYPPGWKNAASSLQEFPMREIGGQNVSIIDPWVYMDRLGIFKIMVQATEDYFKPWGKNNTGNLLWGLPLQFGWQMTSGRLQVETDYSHLAIFTGNFTTKSWWADMNYYLSIIPFLGAVTASIIDSSKYPFHILLPTNVTAEVRDKFCTSVTQCQSRYPELMNKWKDFFGHLRNNDVKRDSRAAMDVTIGLMWQAHTASIHTASPMFVNELSLLPAPEMHFGRGWALLVDFIAATHFKTNLNNTHQQQAIALPPRILHSGDRLPYIADFTKCQNSALYIINIIYETEKLTQGGFLYIWRKAMCSEKGRADGRSMLENLLQHPFVVMEDLIKLVVDFLKDHDC